MEEVTRWFIVLSSLSLQMQGKATREIDMYYCEAKRIEKLCKESFWGVQLKAMKETHIKVEYHKCRNAVRNQATSVTKRQPSDNAINFKCSWQEDHSKVYKELLVHKIQGSVREDSVYVKQFPSTKCHIRYHQCTPTEQPLGLLISIRKGQNHELFTTHKIP